MVIRSAGDATIAATNGDLNVIGSDIAGQNVALAASHDLNLLSQAEQHSQKDASANASGEVGISIGSTTGIYVSAAAGLARAHGNGTTHVNSSVTASDTLSLISGNDTTIQGAQVSRPRCPKPLPPFPRRIFDPQPPRRREDFSANSRQWLTDGSIVDHFPRIASPTRSPPVDTRP